MRILLVEDDIISQKLTVKFLAGLNMDVSVASTGTEALSALRTDDFDLALMDLDIPEIDGAEVVRRVRAGDTKHSNLAIFAFTASAAINSRQKAQALLMNDFISKPLDPFQLHIKINDHVIGPAAAIRPIKINFDLFRETDVKFRYELTTLMVQNILELERASFKSYYTSDIKCFHSATHKAKSTLTLLNDNEYLIEVDDLKARLSTDDRSEICKRIKKFSMMSASIVKTLQAYLTTLRPLVQTTHGS